ncbi:MAG: T9SS type A sorting domain-containing protein [Rhodothermales bacterium]|nr:T9SS type A sorting domain-containing protein [Rhodothermales bacterium]
MKWFSLLTATLVMLGMALTQDGTNKVVLEPTYIGSQACINCHTGRNPEIVSEYQKSGHPYKLNEVTGGVAPTYPANTTTGPVLPPGTSWDDFAYVIGGYGWKARFVKPDGRVYTVGDSAQYNLPSLGASASLGRDASWAAYHKGEDKKYNYGCFQCHTTGPTPEGSWNNVVADSLGTFSEPGIRCEGCHGPGSDHQAGAFADPPVLPPNSGDYLKITRCGECHQRGGATNAIPVSGGYIRHHEQVNEMRASAHGDGVGTELTCASCHNPHVTVRYPDATAPGQEGITTQCETCHPAQSVNLNGMDKPINCIDCHMPRASKSAVGAQVGNGWIGDVRTHIFGINTGAFTKDEAMFAAGGGSVALDGNGLAAVTMDFACLQCHTDKDVQWAANYAMATHSGGFVTDVDDASEVPATFALEQNYPNPFNPSTTIRYAVPEAADVSIRVFDATGRLVGTLVQNMMPPGNHSVTMDASGLSSGMYFYELKAGDVTQTKAMILSK